MTARPESPIEFVGDLSIPDAKELVSLGSKSSAILEFGMGGSTQLFAQCKPPIFVSVDTDPAWIERTKENLCRISHDDWCGPKFVPYDLFLGGTFDLIFVDGAPDRRLDFAMHTWPMLDVGGVMVFHDTRRFEYFREAAWVMQSFFSEVRAVEINPRGTNLTIIEKGEPVAYDNWNYSEGKPLWAYGAEPMPEGEKLWVLEVE